MSAKYVVDTHTLIWHLEGNLRLEDRARGIMNDPESSLLVPIVVLAEACWIVEHGRSSIPSVKALMADVDADPRIRIVLLNRQVFDRYLTVTGDMEMHDRLIVATALELATKSEPVAILSADRSIRSSGLVSVVW
jgi:PIN domain nuclease of toxin-antitoxin system